MATVNQGGFERYRKYYQVLEPVLQQPKTRAYTMAIFSFLAVSLFGWYAIRPTISTILFLQREIADKTQINRQMEEKITALIEAQAAYEAAQPQLALVGQAIPQNSEVLGLASQVRNLVAISGSSVSAVQIPTVPLVGQEATAGSKLAEKKQADFSFTTVMNGPYSVIKSILDQVIDMRRIVTVETVNLRPAREGPTQSSEPGTTGGTILQLILKLKAYYQGQ